MQKVNSSWGRMVLALVVVLAIAGPGMVLAATGPGYSVPETAVIEGTFTAANGGVASLFVTFTDGSTGTVTTQASWAATTSANPAGATGSFSGNVYTASPSAVAGTTRVLFKSVYTSDSSSVSASRVVTLQ
jgi:hypothetical protein